MPKYSRKSLFALRSCTQNLQRLFTKIVQRYDNSITEGHRGETAQNRAFDEGRSKLRFPNGKHNRYPSNAVDSYPYPIKMGGPLITAEGKLNHANLQALLRFYHYAGYVQGVADEMGVPIRWGGDWDGDFDFSDQSFNDLVHFEEKES